MGQHRSGQFRGSHSILRLDSTGEVTSDKKSKPQTRTFGCQRRNLTSAPTERNGGPYLKKLVDNFNVSSILNSANMYIDTAASYIESYCPRPTVTEHLTKEGPANSNSLGFIKNIFSSGKSDFTTTAMKDCVTDVIKEETVPCHYNKVVTTSTTDTNTTWSCSSLLCAFHSYSFLNGKGSINTSNMTLPKVGLYVPPQRRMMEEQPKRCGVIDPKLTPYNARLLEKSRKCSNKNSSKTTTQPPIPKPVVNDQEKAGICVERCAHELATGVQVSENTQETIVVGESSTKPDIACAEQMDDSDGKQSDSQRDWFEYECTERTVIPIIIDGDKLESCLKNSKSQPNTVVEDSESPRKQLHNWYSVELDKSVQKSETSSSVNSSHSENAKQNTSNDTGSSCDLKAAETEPSALNVKSPDNSEEVQQNGLKEGFAKPKQSAETGEHQPQVRDISAVLYVRQCAKKRRPSKKKRQRQKAQLEQGKLNPSLKLGSAVHPRSPVAFILGVDSKSSENIHSFQLTCDIDSADFDSADFDESDSDFSSSDSEEFSSLDDDELLGLRCNDPISGFDMYTVSCSIQPTSTTVCPASPSPTDKEIQEINQMWQIHISIQPELKTKSSSSKKVYNY